MHKFSETGRDIISAVLFVFLCWNVANMVMDLGAGGVRLGLLAAHGARFLVLLALLGISRLSKGKLFLRFWWPRSGLSFKSIPIVIVLALALGATLFFLLSVQTISLPSLLGTILSILCIGLSLYFILTKQTTRGLVTAILTWPLLLYGDVDGWFFGLPVLLTDLSFPTSYSISLTTLTLYMILLMIAWAYRCLIDHQIPTKTIFHWPIRIFLLAGVISTLFSLDPAKSLLYLLFAVLMPVVFLVFVANSVSSWDEVKAVLRAAGVSAGMMGMMTLYYALYRASRGIMDVGTALAGRNVVFYGYVGTTGTLSLGDFATGAAAYMVPVLIALAMSTAKSLQKVIWSAIGLLMVIVTCLSFARVEWLMVVLGVAPWFFVKSKMRPVLFLFVMVLVLSAVTVPTDVSLLFSRFSGLTSLQGVMSESRIPIWQAALEMFRDHLWTGVGLGMWRDIYGSYIPARLVISPHAHSGLFQLAAEAGILGVVTFFGFLSVLTSAAWRLLKRARSLPPSRLAFSVGFVGVSLALCLEFVLMRLPLWPLGSPYQSPSILFAWTLLGLLGVVLRLEISKPVLATRKFQGEIK